MTRIAAFSAQMGADGDGPAEWVVTANPPPPSLTVIGDHPVRPNARYGLRWAMKVEGEKRWRFRAKFSGIIISFSDEKGSKIHALERHTSCWQTPGWQPAWLLFRSPEGAARLSVSFAIVSAEPLPGQFGIRDVELEDLDAPPARSLGGLCLRTCDESGTPVSARAYVRSSEGKNYASPYAFSYNQGGAGFCLQDLESGWIPVPPGSYRVTATKGFEYDTARAWATVRPGFVTQVDLVLRHRFLASRKGWFCGDHHVHLFRHGSSAYPMMNVKDIHTLAKAEGLGFLAFMGSTRMEPEDRGVREPGFLATTEEELTRDLWGHICPIGVGRWASLERQGEAWPMNYDLIVSAEEAGGAIVYAHPYGPLRKDKEFRAIASLESGLIAREYPIDLALGKHCALDMLTKEDARGDFGLKLRDYMRLLNLGFRTGVTGSTDFHADQGRQPVGAVRTYVRVNSLTWPHIAAAYREGRTFASNGPLLSVSAGGVEPGGTVRLESPGGVSCEIGACSLWGIESVEIWRDGQKAAELDAREGEVHEKLYIDVPHGGWMLAVAKGDPNEMVVDSPEGKPMVRGQCAISSPIYFVVERAEQPMDGKAARYYTNWVRAVVRVFEAECQRMAGDGLALPSEKRFAVLERLHRASRVFEAKAL